MKKRLFALLLALCLCIPASAAQNSTENFVRQRNYTGQFSDLNVSSPFYKNVAALYEYGLSEGRADGTYGLTDPMTVGQVMIFAARIRSLYRTGSPSAGPDAQAGGGAAQRASRYLQAEGVLDGGLEDSLNLPATRAQVAHVLAGVLPESALPVLYDELITQAYASRRYITDVTEYTPYYTDILSLYRRGVSMGSNDRGAFQPDSQITRGAAAAMLTRMVEPDLRVKPSWNLASLYSAKGTLLSDLVEPGEYCASPATNEEMDSSIRHMLSQGSHQLVLNYPGITPARARQIMEWALSAIKVYCEQSYNAVDCNYSSAGTVTLDFSATAANGKTESYRASAMESAIAVHDQMWEDGTITTDMTDKEKARVYYDWVCNHCAYDYKAGNESLSHIAYSVFSTGVSVCDGYTGAYNMLLKLEGIDCYAISNSAHIWTVATLDGETCHIDTTWGDSGSAISYDYFAMTPAQSRTYHSW